MPSSPILMMGKSPVGVSHPTLDTCAMMIGEADSYLCGLALCLELFSTEKFALVHIKLNQAWMMLRCSWVLIVTRTNFYLLYTSNLAARVLVRIPHSLLQLQSHFCAPSATKIANHHINTSYSHLFPACHFLRLPTRKISLPPSYHSPSLQHAWWFLSPYLYTQSGLLYAVRQLSSSFHIIPTLYDNSRALLLMYVAWIWISLFWYIIFVTKIEIIIVWLRVYWITYWYRAVLTSLIGWVRLTSCAVDSS